MPTHEPNWLRSSQILNGSQLWTAGTYKAVLLGTTWTRDDNNDSDWTYLSAFQVTGVSGIAADGITIGSRTVDDLTQSAKQLYAADVVFSPAATLTARGAAIYESTSNKVLCTITFKNDAGADVDLSVPSGQTLTLDFPSPTGSVTVDIANPDSTAMTKRTLAAITALPTKTKRVMTGIQYGSVTDPNSSLTILNGVKSATGKTPLILGFETAIGGYKGTQFPELSATKMTSVATEIKRVAALGHLPVLAWHVNNPDPNARVINGGTNYDYAGPGETDPTPNPCNFVNLTTPGHQTYVNWMLFISTFGDFVNTLVSSSGVGIPVLFRPWHEMQGGDFWWSAWNPTVLANGGAQFRLGWQQMFNMLCGRKGATQMVNIANASGGTFTLTFNGQTTSGIAYNASAATVQSALEALNNIAPGDISVSKATNMYTVTFAGAYATGTVPYITGSSASLSGTGKAVQIMHSTGCNNLIWVYHCHNHDPKGWNTGSSSFSGYSTGWEALYPGDNYVDILSASVYEGSWGNANNRGAIVNRLVQIHERVNAAKPFITCEIGPRGWPPNVDIWDMGTMLTRLKADYVDGNNAQGNNTSGLKPFVVGWMHWSGSWDVQLQTNYVSVFQDAISCNLGDLVI